MRLLILLVTLCLQSLFVSAQKNLSGSLQHSVLTKIYKITDVEAKKLSGRQLRNVNETYLRALVDSFPTAEKVPALSPGNYLFVHAERNKLRYKLYTAGDVLVDFISNHRDISVFVHGKEGKIISDANVAIGRKHLSFNSSTDAYGPIRARRSATAHVVFQNTYYSFPVNIRRSYQRRIGLLNRVLAFRGHTKQYYSYFNGQTRYEEDFRGFLAFSKPKYRRGDTVRIKAFVETDKGRFLNRPLILRLTDDSFNTDTILSTVHPYRAGAYEYEFVLNDSLDLSLDDDYLITLEEESSRKYDVNEYDGDLDEDEYAAKRRVVMRGKFSYEDYELNQVNFTAWTDKKKHSRNVEASVYLKAVDENNLPVLDGRVEIFLLAEPSGYIVYHKPQLFLADTLFRHSQTLESLSETKITIPDSVFPRASFDYTVQCNFRNASNELHTQTLRQHFRDDSTIVDFVQDNDTLSMRYLKLGKSEPISGTLYIFNQAGETLTKRNIRLPSAVKINAFESKFEFVSADLRNSFEVQHDEQLVDLSYHRNTDSVYIDVTNCCGIKIWYTIFAGNRIIRRGFADSVSFHEKSITKKNYFLSLQYVFAGHFYEGSYSVPFEDKQLKIEVNQPERVEPGQSAKIEIAVSDSRGKPVPNADLTAYAVTGKLGSTSPAVPYLGKIYPSRRPLFYVSADEKPEQEKDEQLNWKRWSRELHLDTIEYYHFLFPRPIYTNTEIAPDNITQIAPFVVSHGEVQPVQFLYIDEIPVFFLQSRQINLYSFAVSPGRHSLRMRISDKMISLDSVFVEKGKKTFLSVDADTTFRGLSVTKMPIKMTDHEIKLWQRYMIVVENTFGGRYAYVRQQGKVYLLNNEQFTSQSILVGPLTNADAQYVLKDGFRQSFQAEGAWHYTISEGLVKQKWYENEVPFDRYLVGSNDNNFGDYVMTEKEVDSLWQDYLDYRSSTVELFKNTGESRKESGRLRIGLSESFLSGSPFIKSVILFRKDNPDFIRIYPGQTRDLGYLLAGSYRLLVLLKGGRYFLEDNISVRANGINYYSLNIAGERPRDKMSDSIQRVIATRIDLSGPAVLGLDKIRRAFNDQYFDVSLLTDFISGVVVDERGESLAGVSIVLKGTSFGTFTGSDGTFSMKSPLHGTLVVAAVGYEIKELAIQTSTSYRITLTPVSQNLQEVVVTGYGIARKRNLTAAVANALSGRVAGVNIIVRGAATLRAGEMTMPLVTIPGSQSVGDTAIGIATNSLRRNFRDEAFWRPRLSTDINGRAAFTVTFPDDITNWNMHVIAMATNKQTGSRNGIIRAYRTVSGNIALPMFAVAGDSINVIGKALNYLSERAQLNRKFYINDELRREGEISFSNSWIDTFMVHVPQQDSLKLKYIVTRNDGYFDGEERKIPVFKPGVLETNGIFAALNGDTSIQYTPSSDTSTVKIYAETSMLPVLEQEAEHIRNYEYLCNEQLASKLKAMLVLKKVREYLHQPFDGEADIRTLIKKLNQNRHSSGLWGWWQGNEPTLWISLHAIEALLAAEKEGYAITLDKRMLSDYLIYNIESQKGFDKLSSVEMLFQLQSKADLKKYVDSLTASKTVTTLYDQLRLIRLKQQLDMPVTIDTLIMKSSRTAFGNVYWGRESYHFFDNAVQNTLQMYHVLKSAGRYETMLRAIRNYFLEKRRSGYWRNTYESSLILETILPDILAESPQRNPVSLSLQYSDSVTTTKFPFSMEIKNPGNIKITKNGALPVYFTAYQQHWNSSPVKVTGNFDVQTLFQKNGGTSLLKAGTPVTMVVKVNVKADADYVMIEAPIPAGCSYAGKEQSFVNNEVHREYFRNKVSIFCSSLVAGKYEFKVELLPRYTGVYTLNPAKAEMMYFPVFNGREELKKVTIQP